MKLYSFTEVTLFNEGSQQICDTQENSLKVGPQLLITMVLFKVQAHPNIQSLCIPAELITVTIEAFNSIRA